MSSPDTLKAYFKWLHKNQPKLEPYYKQLFSKYSWLKPAMPKTGKISKRHPRDKIRPKSLRTLCFLVDKMSEEGIIVGKLEKAILMQLIMKWIGCTRRTAFDYATALLCISIRRYCLL